VLERIEAAPVAAAARSRESEAVAALPGRRASVVAPAVVAVVVDPAVAQEVAAVAAAEAAGKKVSSVEWNSLDTRPSTLVSHWWRKK
jgi:hypothetical protein